MLTRIFGLLTLLANLTAVYLFEISASAPSSFPVLHWPAILLTGLGPLSLVLLCSDWGDVRDALAILTRYKISSGKGQRQESELLIELAKAYYVNGPKAFAQSPNAAFSPLLAETLKHLADRIPLADAVILLEKSRKRAEARFSRGAEVLALGMRLAPSVGMLGTILGMIHLLSSLTDTTHIGSHMSLALLTTFYGLFFSLVLWTPLHRRCEAARDSELGTAEQTLSWLEILEARKPVQYFENSHGMKL